MKVLYSREYLGRVLYVIEDDNKVFCAYRSSGLSGTGHKDSIIPFMYLNIRDPWQSPGYINKLIYFGARYIKHQKDFTRQPKIKKYLETVQELTKDLTVDTLPNTEVECVKDILDLAKEINTEIRTIIMNREEFDFIEVEEEIKFNIIVQKNNGSEMLFRSTRPNLEWAVDETRTKIHNMGLSLRDYKIKEIQEL